MKFLSVAGTAAMFLVGGGILAHGIPPLHHAVTALGEAAAQWPAIGGVAHVLVPLLANMMVGVGGRCAAPARRRRRAARVARAPGPGVARKMRANA